MKKIILVLIIPTLLASSCNNNNGIKIICPLGAPSLCFYSEVNNDNFVTSGAKLIPPHFQNNDSIYDALVIDSITGLNQSKKHNSNFKFAKLLTAGNLYFVGLKNNDIPPSATSNIVAFGEENLTGLVFDKLIDDNPTWQSWNINKDNIVYRNDVSEVGAVIKNGSFEGKTINYALVAEPIKTNLESYISNTFSISLNDSFKEIGGDLIPQAALFIKQDSWNNKKASLKEFINKIDTNISIAINKPLEMKTFLEQNASEDIVTKKFNFSPTVAYNVMKNNNGFALYSSKEEYGCDKINSFLNILYNTHEKEYFSKDYFININD